MQCCLAPSLQFLFTINDPSNVTPTVVAFKNTKTGLQLTDSAHDNCRGALFGQIMWLVPAAVTQNDGFILNRLWMGIQKRRRKNRGGVTDCVFFFTYMHACILNKNIILLIFSVTLFRISFCCLALQCWKKFSHYFINLLIANQLGLRHDGDSHMPRPVW